MDRDDAIEIKRLALQAIESLSRTLLVEAVGGEGERSVALRRAVGTLIGEVDVGVLVRVYEAFPDLDDLR